MIPQSFTVFQTTIIYYDLLFAMGFVGVFI